MRRNQNSCTLLAECKTMQPVWETVWWCLRNLKIELPFDFTISLLGTCPKELKIGSWRDTCTSVLMAEFFTITERWKWSKCPSTDEWMKKNVIYTDNGILLNLKKEGSSDTRCNMDEPWGQCAKGNNPVTKKPNTIWFQFYEVLKAPVIYRGRK